MSQRLNGEQVMSFALEAFGVRVGITLCSSALMGRVSDFLPPGWVETDWKDLRKTFQIGHSRYFQESNGSSAYELLEDEMLVLRVADADQVCQGLGSRLENFVAEQSDEYVFIHAGVVSLRGKAIVLPGHSLAGKSTLTAALVAAGANYCSDEYAVLDHLGRVFPYPRWVSLRDGPLGPTCRIDLRNRLPGEQESAGGMPVDLVAILRYSPGAPWHVERLERGSAVLSMCDHAIGIRHRPGETLRRLNLIAGSAPVIKGSRDEAESAAARLLAACASDMDRIECLVVGSSQSIGRRER